MFGGSAFGTLPFTTLPVVVTPPPSTGGGSSGGGGGGGRITPWSTSASEDNPVSRHIARQALQSDDEEVILLLTQLVRILR